MESKSVLTEFFIKDSDFLQRIELDEIYFFYLAPYWVWRKNT